MDSIIWIFNTYNDYLKTLSLTELLALINIFGLNLILLSSSTWITVCVSDFLINRFDLENRSPFFKKLISRRKPIGKNTIIIQAIKFSFSWCIIMSVDVIFFINWRFSILTLKFKSKNEITMQPCVY